MNHLIIDNFTILCAFYKYHDNVRIFNVYKSALDEILKCDYEIKQCNIPLHVTKFDGLNTRNKIKYILQFGKDLDEVTSIRQNVMFSKIWYDYSCSEHVNNG